MINVQYTFPELELTTGTDIFDKMDNLIITSDDKGTVDWVNKGFLNLTGIPKELIIGKKIEEILHSYGELNGNNETNSNQEIVKIVSSDNTPYYYHFNTTKTKDLKGNNKIIFIGSDITKQIRSKIRLKKYTAELEEKVNRFKKYSSKLHHDLRSPLRALFSISQWIEEDISDAQDDLKDHLNLMKKSVLKMNELVNNLKKVELENEEVIKINIKQLLQEITESVMAPPGFTFEFNCQFPVFETTKAPLKAVFTHLIDNAVKHHPSTKGNVIISCSENEDYMKFSVTDDGAGMEPKYSQWINEFFAKNDLTVPKDNTCLGLSLIRKIIKENNGKIYLTSIKGEGSTFTFHWPKRIKQHLTPLTLFEQVQ